jgi:hypothetical protein
MPLLTQQKTFVFKQDLPAAELNAEFGNLYQNVAKFNAAETITGAWVFSNGMAVGNGSAATPGIRFSSALASGLFLAGSSGIGFTTVGVERATLDNTGLDIAPTGTAAVPALRIGNDQDSGLYSNADDDLRITVSGSDKMALNAAGVDVTGTLDVSGDVTATTFRGVDSFHCMLSGWRENNIPATVAANRMSRFDQTAVFLVVQAPVMPFGGSITGVAASVTSGSGAPTPITAGTVTVRAKKYNYVTNTVGAALTTILDSTNSLVNFTTTTAGSLTFVAGEAVLVTFETAGLSPASTLELAANVTVEFSI